MTDHYDRNEIIAANPLLDYCQARGWELRRDGPRWKCLCPLHREDSPSFTIYNDNHFHCYGCGAGGTVIDLHMKLRGIDAGAAMKELSPHGANGNDHPKVPRHNAMKSSPPSSDTQPPKEVAAYDYQDATGKVVFQVVRYEPKTFKQCRIVDGERVWNLEGVERLPYRLPELLCHPTSVWIVEGEKDVEALRAVGQAATCNPGGAGKWLPAFSQYLKGKCVYIVADNDEPGQKHAREVLKSLEGSVEWVKWIELPKEHNGRPIKDITDLHIACQSDDAFLSNLELLQAKARLIERAIDSRSFTMAELEAQYIAEKTRFGEVCLPLNNWLPKLAGVRPLGPGDVLGIMAGTGQLKTAAVQNILACNSGLPALLFQLELSGPLMFERSSAIATGIGTSEINDRYLRGERVDWQTSGKLKNLLVSTSSMTMKEIGEEIARSSAKLGCLPRVFVVDYVQLIRGRGSRYERVSEACEEVKRLAKKWHAIGIIVSQVSRPEDDDDPEVGIYDAKESGSFENSCSVVLGIWKTSLTEMTCRVLKNTKGLAGNTVAMKIRDGTFIIEPA